MPTEPFKSINPPSLRAMISADGKCSLPPESLRTLIEKGVLKRLEIEIDAGSLCGGTVTSTLLGTSSSYLSVSCELQLLEMKEKEEGKCLFIYSVKLPEEEM